MSDKLRIQDLPTNPKPKYEKKKEGVSRYRIWTFVHTHTTNTTFHSQTTFKLNSQAKPRLHETVTNNTIISTEKPEVISFSTWPFECRQINHDKL